MLQPPKPHDDEVLRQLAQDLIDNKLFIRNANENPEQYFLDLQLMTRRKVQGYLSATELLYQHKTHTLLPKGNLYPYAERLSPKDATTFWRYVAEFEHSRGQFR